MDNQSYELNFSATSRSEKSDVESYINLPLVPHYEDSEFDILENWKGDEKCNLPYWKTQSVSYPVLSRMARDILAIPITSIASESSFNMEDRILNKLRAKLLPKNVEIFVTTRNWLFGFEPKERDDEYLTVVNDSAL
ncbi:hypothetical protein GQ457_12G016370 [Hibiscus cannabinus]